MLLWFFELCVAAQFSFFFLALRLVVSYRPSVGPPLRYIIGLIVPANSNLVPSGLGLRPERMQEGFCFVLLSFLFFSFRFVFFFCLFLPFFALCVAVLSSPLFRVYACTMAMFLVLSRSN